MALSLYGYNVSPLDRAQKIYDHFRGDCAELPDLVQKMSKPAHLATELAYPSAVVYVQHALDRYGEEARIRARINSAGI